MVRPSWQRLGRKRRSASSGQNRRGLRFESLETRSLLSATVLPSISGIVYQDPTGSGLTSDDSRLANVTVNLFRDGGDGVFEGKNRRQRRHAGRHGHQRRQRQVPVQQPLRRHLLRSGDPVPGLVIPSGQGVQTVVITSSDLQGTTGTTIDSFASTSQYVSGSLHGGKTGTSSAIDLGRHRRPSQPVRATHLGRRRRVAGRELRLARPAGLRRQRGLQRHLLGQLGRQQQQRRRAEPDRPGRARHHVARRQHGHRAQRGRRPRQRLHHAQGLQRCQRLVLGQRSHHQHQRRFAEQQRQPVRRLLQLHGRRRHGGQLLPGRRHPVVDQRRECHRRPGGTDRGRRTDGLQRELRQLGPGRPGAWSSRPRPTRSWPAAN